MSKVYKYPDSIADAVKVLDEACVGWVEKINVDILNMKSQKCVLGQIFHSNSITDSYGFGMTKLFALALGNNLDNPYRVDTVFGENADILVWKDEIKRRVKEVEYTIQGLGVKFLNYTGMMVRNNQEYNLVLSDGNQWGPEKISVNPRGLKTITKSELEKLYGIKITELFPATFTLLRK